MKKNLQILSTLVIVTLMALPQAGSAQEPTSFEELNAWVKEHAQSVDSWTGEMNMTMNMQGMTVAMKGPAKAKGERMAMEMTMDMMGQQMSTKTVVDADGISWTETSAMGQQMVVKMDMQVMAEMSEEMSGINVPGVGGGMPMDMTMDPATLLDSYATMYDMELKEPRTENGTEVYVLEGRFKKEVAADLDPTGAMAAMGIDMDSLEVLIGKKDAFPRKMTLSGKDGVVYMVMAFDNIVLNPEIPDSEFEYTPPDGAQVMDMTEMMLDATQGIESGDFDADGFDLPTAKFEPGDIAPDFEGPGLHGKAVKLSDYRGKVVLLDFWASWCGPCVHEMPNVIAAYGKYRDRGFEVIGISLDDEKSALDGFLSDRPGMTWTQVYEAAGWESAIGRIYGVDAIPATFLIDRDGVIQAVDVRGDRLSAKVEELLGN